jgi:hypothetical protein
LMGDRVVARLSVRRYSRPDPSLSILQVIPLTIREHSRGSKSSKGGSTAPRGDPYFKWQTNLDLFAISSSSNGPAFVRQLRDYGSAGCSIHREKKQLLLFFFRFNRRQFFPVLYFSGECLNECISKCIPDGRENVGLRVFKCA